MTEAADCGISARKMEMLVLDAFGLPHSSPAMEAPMIEIESTLIEKRHMA
jgi:hypothetical protein